MDETKRRILEEAGFGKEFIKELEEGDAALEKAGVTDEMIIRSIQRTQEEMRDPEGVDFEKITRLCTTITYSINTIGREFILSCHWDESWRNRRKIKKALNQETDRALLHIKTCAKCQELLPYLIRGLQNLLIQK